MTPFDTSGDKRKNGGGDNNNNNNRGSNDGGGRGGNSNCGGCIVNDGVKRGGNDGGIRGGVSGGSIINASGQNMTFPATLSKQYCGYFTDTELRCNFGQSCKKEHSSFPIGFIDADVSKMLSFVQSTRAPSV